MPGGRKPKPAALKLVTGNPGRRPIKAESVDLAATGELEIPDWVHDTSYRVHFIAEWERVVPVLRSLMIAGQVNQGAIEGLCSLYAQAVRCTMLGQMSEARQSFDAYRKMCNEFGLTPASKGRVTTGENAQPKDPAEAFFGT